MTTQDQGPPLNSEIVSLDLQGDLDALTCALIDIPSVSGDEKVIADSVQASLSGLGHLDISRFGHTIVARTNLGHSERIILGGHLDTVPANDNLKSEPRDSRIYGLGACDMKGGVAVALKLARQLEAPTKDITYLFYECEEVDSARNGLAKLAVGSPEMLEGDFAVLMEPTNAGIEAGCQGSLRFELNVDGQRAHSARSWMGSNAIHSAGDVLAILNAYQPRVVEIDGLEYREGLNAVGIHGGIAGNVIPDLTTVTINYRYAPSRSPQEAIEHMKELFEGYEVIVKDNASGALPGLGQTAGKTFLDQIAEDPRPKFGWTDVARFSELGIPAVNFGPGDPSLAHHKDEFVEVDQLESVYRALHDWLS